MLIETRWYKGIGDNVQWKPYEAMNHKVLAVLTEQRRKGMPYKEDGFAMVSRFYSPEYHLNEQVRLNQEEDLC